MEMNITVHFWISSVYNIEQKSLRGFYLFSFSGSNSRTEYTLTKRNEIQQQKMIYQFKEKYYYFLILLKYTLLPSVPSCSFELFSSSFNHPEWNSSVPQVWKEKNPDKYNYYRS